MWEKEKKSKIQFPSVICHVKICTWWMCTKSPDTILSWFRRFLETILLRGVFFGKLEDGNKCTFLKSSGINLNYLMLWIRNYYTLIGICLVPSVHSLYYNHAVHLFTHQGYRYCIVYRGIQKDGGYARVEIMKWGCICSKAGWRVDQTSYKEGCDKQRVVVKG